MRDLLPPPLLLPDQPLLPDCPPSEGGGDEGVLVYGQPRVDAEEVEQVVCGGRGEAGLGVEGIHWE